MVLGALRRSKGPGCSRRNVVEAASRSRQSEKAEDRQNDETRSSRILGEQFARGVKSVRSHFRRKEVTYVISTPSSKMKSQWSQSAVSLVGRIGRSRSKCKVLRLHREMVLELSRLGPSDQRGSSALRGHPEDRVRRYRGLVCNQEPQPVADAFRVVGQVGDPENDLVPIDRCDPKLVFETKQHPARPVL
jgi:hypothetical protein